MDGSTQLQSNPSSTNQFNQSANTVFIVDDDQAARESVAALVNAKGLTARTFASGPEFLDEYAPVDIGCLVSDVKMQPIDGLELLRTVKKRGYDLPVILITAFGDVRSAVEAMTLGAVTYLEKPYRTGELLDNIQLALERDDEQHRDNKRREAIRQKLATLTDEEMDVLRCMVSGFLNKQIKERLVIGLRTVEARRKSVKEKLGAISVAEVVRIALIGGVTPYDDSDAA